MSNRRIRLEASYFETRLAKDLALRPPTKPTLAKSRGALDWTGTGTGTGPGVLLHARVSSLAA